MQHIKKKTLSQFGPMHWRLSKYCLQNVSANGYQALSIQNQSLIIFILFVFCEENYRSRFLASFNILEQPFNFFYKPQQGRRVPSSLTQHKSIRLLCSIIAPQTMSRSVVPFSFQQTFQTTRSAGFYPKTYVVGKLKMIFQCIILNLSHIK